MAIMSGYNVQPTIYAKDILAILGCIWCAEFITDVGFAELALVFEIITFL